MRSRPVVGVGIGLRHEHAEEVLRTSRQIDWLEILPENFMDRGGPFSRALDACRERWPIHAHGVSLNVGGPDPLDAEQLHQLAALIDRVGSATFSEHLCYSAVRGRHFHELLPLPFTPEAAAHVAQRARAIAATLGRPLLLENITAYATMPGGTLAEGAFVSEVIEDADCGLLLDLNNAYINAVNRGQDPLEAVLALPLSRARQLHLAGHRREGHLLIDDHGSAVAEPVWQLYRETLRRTGPLPVLIEWDTHLPPLDALLDEADRARQIQAELFAPPAPREARLGARSHA